MNKETDFFIYLLEQYAFYKNSTADKILANWENLNLVDYVYDMYEMYHTERLENAYADIDNKTQAKNNAR